MRSRSLALLAVLLATGGTVAFAADATLVPRLLVLQPADVGAGYVENASFSGQETLQDAASGDSAAVRRRLQKVWVGGYRAGFNGRTVQRGVVSTADVFRSSTIADIERAWKSDLITQIGGRPMATPASAPGTFRVLARGSAHVGAQSLEVLLYVWQQGRVVASVNVTGTPNSFSTALLMRLVARQDAKLRRGLRP
ncbi:MAG: hypothetical protein WAU41_09490 [Gaiellaceae bacterium]